MPSLVICWFASAGPLLLQTTHAADSRPNILFCIADDLGWPTAGAYGDTVVRTPTFDRLAREGVLFNHAYVAAPSCTPSRASILTGRMFYELEEGGILWSFLPNKYTVFPDLLEKSGYALGLTGILPQHSACRIRFRTSRRDYFDHLWKFGPARAC